MQQTHSFINSVHLKYKKNTCFKPTSQFEVYFWKQQLDKEKKPFHLVSRTTSADVWNVFFQFKYSPDTHCAHCVLVVTMWWMIWMGFNNHKNKSGSTVRTCTCTAMLCTCDQSIITQPTSTVLHSQAEHLTSDLPLVMKDVLQWVMRSGLHSGIIKPLFHSGLFEWGDELNLWD